MPSLKLVNVTNTTGEDLQPVWQATGLQDFLRRVVIGEKSDVGHGLLLKRTL